MSFRTIPILIAIICVVSLLAIPFASPQAMPGHTIFGTVTDENDAPIAGATVTLRNGRTGGIISATTGSTGNYDVSDISFQTGDVITVKAVSGNLEGSSSVTVSALPLDQCNIVLSEKTEISHTILGNIGDENGAPIAGATVTLRNGRTGGIISATTGSTGNYDVNDISFQTGDVLTVKAISGNLEGSSSVTVSALPIDQCDIVLSEKTEINPIVIGGVVAGLIGLIILAVLYSRASKEASEEQEPKKRRRRE